MKLFKSGEPNTFYYVTSVTHNRVPVFRSQRACEILFETFAEVRERFPFKLVAYVIMPDHFHFIVNPKDCDISKLLLRVRGNSARKIIHWLQEEKHLLSLQKLRLKHKQKREHTYSLWQKDPSVIDLYSHKFLVQKSGYIHHNPVRAGLTITRQNGVGRAITRPAA